MVATPNGPIRAAVVERVGEPPEVDRIEPPQESANGTLVAPRYGTLNPIEVRIAAGREGAAPEVPYVPGMEGVGRVVSGDGLDAGSAVRFECRLPGRGSDGALAELAVAEPDSLVVLPDGIDEGLAAAVGVIGVTADLALDAAEAIARARVVVLGASGSVGGSAAPRGWSRPDEIAQPCGARSSSAPTWGSSCRGGPTATLPMTPVRWSRSCARPPVGRSMSSSIRSGACPGRRR